MSWPKSNFYSSQVFNIICSQLNSLYRQDLDFVFRLQKLIRDAKKIKRSNKYAAEDLHLYAKTIKLYQDFLSFTPLCMLPRKARAVMKKTLYCGNCNFHYH